MFVKSIRFAKITKVFEQSIIRCINKSRYMEELFLVLLYV